MILKYVSKKEWLLIGICFALIFLQVYMELEIPEYMSQITLLLTNGGTIEQMMNEGWLMLEFAFGSLLLAIVTAIVAAYVATSLAKRLRKLQFDNVELFSTEEFSIFSPASIITRSTNDVTQVQLAFIAGIQVLIKAPIMIIWAITKISNKDLNWTYATVAALMIIMLTIGIVMYFVIPRLKKVQRLMDGVNNITEEGLSGVRVIHAYNAEAYQENKFEMAKDELTSTNLFVTRTTSVMMPMMGGVMNLLVLSIYIIGGALISASTTEAGRMILFSEMVVLTAYAMMVVMAFITMIIIFMILPRAGAAARRIEEIIDTEPSIRDGTLTDSPAGVEGEIEFKNVSFKYPGATKSVLENISFKVKKGETVAFIGSTGSGKSTLINLVPRFYDVTDGQILVDGVDIRDYKLEALHSKMGYIPQKATLFSGTIYSNVENNDQQKGCTREDVKKAIAIAQGTEFVERMKDGYESNVSEDGINLSGGQKQRLSIARAVCRKPEFYIFDDSFSALDYKTNRILRETLKKETSGVTSLIVAQMISTIIDADIIVVLNEGRVVGIGKHDDLLNNCKVYREIALSQLSEEELIR